MPRVSSGKLSGRSMDKIIKFRPKAKLDLITIYKFSVTNWGADRANQYIYDLEATLQGLLANRLSAMNAEYAGQGLLCYRVISHIVFFIEHADGIEVVRILHKSMDYKRHI